RLAAQNPRVKVLKFVTDSDLLLRLADRVIAMGGYNTVCEALSLDKPLLIVPRAKPRQEQLVRARRLEQLRLAYVLHPDLLCPRKLSDWLRRDQAPLTPARQRLDLDGANKLVPFLEDTVYTSGPTAPRVERSYEYAPP